MKLTRYEVEAIVYWERLAWSIPDLRDVDLSGCKLLGVDLSGVNLSGANLQWANLSGANLSFANLCGANLSEADLKGANLHWANLSESNLSGANLCGANLSDVNLRLAYGSAITTKSDRTISLHDVYRVYVVDDMLFIGCEAHRIHEWFAFSDKEIAEMDYGALKWWRNHGWKEKLFHLIGAADFGIELE